MIKEKKRNEILEGETEKNAADIDYIAMMCDVELESEKEGGEDE